MLQLWGNRIDDDGLVFLFYLIQEHNHHLTNITLNDNFIKNLDTVDVSCVAYWGNYILTIKLLVFLVFKSISLALNKHSFYHT